MYYTEKISGLTQTFRDAVEDFIPRWLESLLPHYHEAKNNNDDILWLANIQGSSGESYEKGGFHYYHAKNGSGLWELSLDGNSGEYVPLNWRECMKRERPEFDKDPDPYMGKFCEFTKNSMYFDPFVERYLNKKPEYCDLSDKVNAYFRQITGDDTVGFSLSRTSMIYFNQRAKMYIDWNYGLW